MSVNVRCDGKRSEMDGAVIFDACGWKGERFPSGYLPHQHSGTCAICAEIDARMTAKPCPRCGARVEQIRRDRIEANP